MSAELEVNLNQYYSELKAAHSDAVARLSNARRVKLGDYNLREDFYEELKSLLIRIYTSSWLRRSYFGANDTGCQSRHLLLAFMSELVYWEYERSFWQKLYEALNITNPAPAYRWFTTQMVRGFEENNIPLIRSGYGWWERKEYVRTIIGESGFSRELVQQAKQFVIWFFDNHAALDPRTLDTESFERILNASDFIWDKDVFELLRDMVSAVSRLLREIRKQSLTSSDLRKSDVLAKLESNLGFHPIRGIFGFRNEEDIQELLEQLSVRVKPQAFYTMLRRKTRTKKTSVWVITPTGQYLEVKQAKDVPVIFGEYRLMDSGQSQIQVVPREALTISKLAGMVKLSQGAFRSDSSNYAWIHDQEPFEVYQGDVEPEEPRLYYVDGLSGYLWYGKQKIGMPLQAERDGQIIDNLSPRTDITLNPRLRLTRDGLGLVVVIPSFVCYEPDLGGKTARLELNNRPIENTTYVIGRNGSLQFQGTRRAEVLPEDNHLEVRLVTVDGNETVIKRTVFKSLNQDFLFNKSSRELIRPGHQYYGGNNFVLFTIADDNSIEIGDDIEVEFASDFGILRVLHLHWKPNSSDPQPFSLKIDEQQWIFTNPLEVYANLLCIQPSTVFQPREPNATFDPDNLQIRLHLYGQPNEVSEMRPKLSFVVEKDNEFLIDFSLMELESLGALEATNVEGEFSIDAGRVLRYLIGQRLTDKDIGTYIWTLMLRPNPLADLEPLSELNFMILPKMQVNGLDAAMIEGESSLITISCEAPLIANDDGNNPSQVLQVDCKPKAVFNPRTKRLEAKTVEQTVRLTYPLTKVSFSFKPNLFAMRLVEQDKAISQPKIAYNKYGMGQLIVLSPTDKPVKVVCNEFVDTVEVDIDGNGRYPIHRLIQTIKHEETHVSVDFDVAQKTFEIVWYPSLQFDIQNCHFEITSEEQGILKLRFNVDGPSSTQIDFRVSDNQLRSHGQQTIELADLRQGSIKFPISLDKLQNATTLHVRALTNGNTLDTIKVLCKRTPQEEAQQQAAEDSQRVIEEINRASISEIPQLLERIEDIGQPDLLEYALQQAYSANRLDKVYSARKRLSAEEIMAYFKYFDPSSFPPEGLLSTPQLKRYCAIPASSLQALCAERLISCGDGVGVEYIIELLVQEKVSRHKGLEILRQNKQCTSEMIRDMVQWDELENESDEYIDLMVSLSEIFHPAIKRRAAAAKDWKRAITLQQSHEILEVNVISREPNGLIVPLGLVTGIVPIEELNTRNHGLRGDRKAIRKQLSQLINATLKLVVIHVDRRKGQLIFSEKQASGVMANRVNT